MEDKIFGKIENIKELIKYIKTYFICKEYIEVEKICENCDSCYREYDGDYGEIYCGSYCSKEDYFSEINEDVNFPYEYSKNCFEISDNFTDSFSIWSIIHEQEWLNEEQKKKIWKHFENKNIKRIKLVEVNK